MFAQRNALAYRLWFFYYRFAGSSKKTIPGRGDSIYLDGYPRSGNTYFTAALKSICPDMRFGNHLHVVAPIKIAIKRHVPVFILMRKPEHAIASYFIHVKDDRSTSSKSDLSEEQLCEILCNEWLTYYEFVGDAQGHLHLIASEAAFENPVVAIEQILNNAGSIVVDDVAEKWKAFDQEFRVHDATKPQGSTSFPDPSRKIEKIRVRDLIRNEPLLAQCDNVYERLLPGSIVKDAEKV